MVHEIVTVLDAMRFSRFGRHLGPAGTFCLDLNVFSFSRPGTGIYFVTLVHQGHPMMVFSLINTLKRLFRLSRVLLDI